MSELRLTNVEDCVRELAVAVGVLTTLVKDQNRIMAELIGFLPPEQQLQISKVIEELMSQHEAQDIAHERR